MDEFLIVFRRDFQTKQDQPSPDQMQAQLKSWKNWFRSLTEQDRLARPLQRWDGEGRVLKQHKTVINGPYVEIKESIGGLIIIRATDYDEAVDIANGCPILELGGSVEIRKAL